MDEAQFRSRPAWRGYFPALTTPFTSKGLLDMSALRAEIDLSILRGAHGLVVGGSSGEWNALGFEQRVQLFEVAADQAAARVPVIAGVSALRPAESSRLAELASDAGAAGVLASVPPYALPTEEEALAFFAGLASNSPLPVMAYNWPLGTGFHISPKLARRLCQVQGIVALKYSSANRAMFFQVLTEVHDKLLVFGSFMNPDGLDVLLKVGGAGTVAGGTVLDEHGPLFWRAVWAGDNETAHRIAELSAQVNGRLFDATFAGPFGSLPATLKAAQELLGQPGGPPAPPHLPLDQDARAGVARVLHEVGLLVIA